jgi:predicted NBD/HSP70 family sugar kinase
MLYVGLDIHSTRISICVLNQTGQVVHHSQVRGIADMLRILDGLGDSFDVCYEASCGYGALPRPAPTAGRPGPGGAPRAAAADLPVEPRDRPQ